MNLIPSIILILFSFALTNYNVINDGLISDNVIKYYLISEEIVLVYIGSGTCNACNDPVNIKNINKIDDILNNNLKSKNYHTISILLINNLEIGSKHISNLTVDFDEIIISEGLNNTGSHKYLFEDFRGRIFVPQIVLLNRKYTYKLINNSRLKTSTFEENELYRYQGKDGIENFANLLEDIDLSTFIVNN